MKLLKLPWPVRAFGSIPCHCRHCLEAVWCEAVYQEVGVEKARVWDLGKLKQRQTLYPPPPYLDGTVTPIHLVIHQLNAVLHALWGQQFGLAHDS